LGEPQARVQREYHRFRILQRYGNALQGVYRLHGSDVVVEFRGGRVNEIDFSTPYYRTKSDFGVGSAIPLGPCRPSASGGCEHTWRGFVWYPRWKDGPCECWVKVGLNSRTLPLEFGRPWFFIFTRHHRVTELYFARKYYD
jgi:hypothetical protein